AGTCFAICCARSDPTRRQSRERAERDAHADPGRPGVARLSIPGCLSARLRALTRAGSGVESRRTGTDAAGDWLTPGAWRVPPGRRARQRLRAADEFYGLDRRLRLAALRRRHGH